MNGRSLNVLKGRTISVLLLMMAVWANGPLIPAWAETVDCSLVCTPDEEDLPFTLSISAVVSNNYMGSFRRMAGRINLITAGGASFTNWRAGYTNLQPGDNFLKHFSINLPAVATLVGLNQFQLVAADVTPPPYNQTPHPPAGDMATSLCQVRGRFAPPPPMVLIPAGEYEMGDHHDGRIDSLPVHEVYIDAFFIDTCEVTNQEYADALNWALAQGGLIDVGVWGDVYRYGGASITYCESTSTSYLSRITWDGSTFGVLPGKENHPMAVVSWYGAAAYSNWRSAMEELTPSYDTMTWVCDFNADGYRLPTEAEWEKAARGGLHNPYLRFPWGDVFNNRIANRGGSDDPYEVSEFIPFTTPITFYNGALHYKEYFDWPGDQTSYQSLDGENGWGLYDMAGNVAEWCNDCYDPDYYSSSPYDNPRGPASGELRVLRGGSFGDLGNPQRCAHRTFHGVDDSLSSKHGFRLALDAE